MSAPWEHLGIEAQLATIRREAASLHGLTFKERRLAEMIEGLAQALIMMREEQKQGWAPIAKESER